MVPSNNMEETFIQESWSVFKNITELTYTICEHINDTDEDDIDSLNQFITELVLLKEDTENCRKEIEDFFGEGFYPYGDEDGPVLYEILEEEEDFSKFHIDCVKEIMAWYEDVVEKIRNMILLHKI